MPRPKTDDPKRVVTLRLRGALVEALEASGDWRAEVEAMIEARWLPGARMTPAPAPKVAKAQAPRFVGLTALGERIERPAAGARLKTGRR